MFPLPLMLPSKLPRRGRSRERAKSRNSLLSFVNLIIAASNHLHSGHSSVSRAEPSLAQATGASRHFFNRGNLPSQWHSHLRGGTN